MLKFEASPEEEFWKVKMERYIDECSSVDEFEADREAACQPLRDPPSCH